MKTPNPSVDLDSVRDRLQAALAGVCSSYLRRDTEARLVFTALLARQHCVFLGLPGTAKSSVLRALTATVTGSRMFEVQLRPTSEVDDVFGGVTIKALEAGTTDRNLTGKLADVEIGYADECFKAPTSVLQALLGAMNERAFDGSPIPLETLVAASNELPAEGEGLDAMFDRFLLRTFVSPVEASKHGDDWLRAVCDDSPGFAPAATISLAELHAAQAAVRAMPFPRAVAEQYREVCAELEGHGLYISVRRAKALVTVLRAAAWLDGSDAVCSDHLAILAHGLWTRQEDIAVVETALKRFEVSVVPQVVALVDEALTAYSAARSDRAAYQANVTKLFETMKLKAEHADRLLDAANSPRARRLVAPKQRELKAAFLQVLADVRLRLGLAEAAAPVASADADAAE